MIINCESCHKDFERPPQPGRIPKRCPRCRSENAIIISKVTPAIEEIRKTKEEKPFVSEEEIIDCSPPDETESGDLGTYRLMVGNLGLAHKGESESEAILKYTHYCQISQKGFGQVGFERVQLWKLDSETNSYLLHKDFIPERQESSFFR